MTERTFDLPCRHSVSGRILWHLDARGLEWTSEDGKDRWMPFACVRWATLGDTPGTGWRLRLSGPPGAAWIEAGAGRDPADIAEFVMLARAIIDGAADTGCGTRFGVNHKRALFGPLWARRARRVVSGSQLSVMLPDIPKIPE